MNLKIKERERTLDKLSTHELQSKETELLIFSKKTGRSKRETVFTNILLWSLQPPESWLHICLPHPKNKIFWNKSLLDAEVKVWLLQSNRRILKVWRLQANRHIFKYWAATSVSPKKQNYLQIHSHCGQWTHGHTKQQMQKNLQHNTSATHSKQ